MNILVTGGTGFVGKALVTALLSRGDSVTVLTRSIEKAQSIFPEKTLQFLTALSTLKNLNAFDAVIILPVSQSSIKNGRFNKKKNCVVAALI